PFRYINEENLKRLAYLLRKEPPKTIALVIGYLKPELVREILSILPPELQTQVAVNMATIRQMTEAQVRTIDREIKEKIDFLVGGLDGLLKVLDDADIETRNNIMDYLEQEKPELYEMVKKSILSFDDIPSFPDQALQMILREIKTESLAKALRDASQDVINKIFSNMSSGASALLKEEMEYGRPLSPEQIEEERKKILDLIKNLEKEGKIVVREREKNTMLQGEEEIAEPGSEGLGGTGTAGSGTAVPQSSQELFQYYQAGVQFFEAGDTDQALNYFNYCVQADPGMWQAHQYLGILYYNAGQYDQARESLEAAARINPREPSIQEWLDSLKAATGGS
ncbi:MAG: tetratricopeptide repeat protein, partial [Elusimicrobia bacterium]|nr:tetratricopeptide repeat protein [Elusimicrobiota bacterium]